MTADNEQPSQKRQLAYKVRIKDVLNGQYMRQSGWEPNYILSETNDKISRVNIIGTIVSISNNEINNHSFLLDDGSGRIAVRFFQDQTLSKDIDIGNSIVLIGRIREYDTERYIVPEIIKNIDNRAWIEVRKLELKKQDKRKKNTPQEPSKNLIEIDEKIIEKEEISNKTELSPTEKVYNLIKELDKGDGTDIEELVEASLNKNIDKIITTLLERGDIFEIRKGKLKVLE